MKPHQVHGYFFNNYSGAKPRINSAYGDGAGPVLLDDVRCTGLEYRLLDCAHRGLEVSNCGHHQDAGVICFPGECK